MAQWRPCHVETKAKRAVHRGPEWNRSEVISTRAIREATVACPGDTVTTWVLDGGKVPLFTLQLSGIELT